MIETMLALTALVTMQDPATAPQQPRQGRGNQPPAVAQATLERKATGTTALRVGYMPIQVKLSATKPDGITKEPEYTATPKYGVVKVGNGPKANHTVVVDEPEGGEWKIYVDANGDGDLTNDGDGKWSNKRDANGRVMYGIQPFTMRASYGGRQGQGQEQSSSDYGLNFYRFVGQDYLLMYRDGYATGELKLGEKIYKVTVIENDADGLYNKRIDDKGKPVNQRGEPIEAIQRPVWLRLELDGKTQQVDARGPFELDGKVYEARIPANGTRLSLVNSTRPAFKPQVATAPPRPPLLAAGVEAPNFTAEKWGGGTVSLADYKGKVLILDFWATWCGPCMRSMPHVEELYKKTRGKDIEVLALCVWDEKAAYEKWVPEKLGNKTFTFPFAFDPAARNTNESIAKKLFNVSGIPTTYIIGKDGKVIDGIVGYGGEKDKRIEEALKKAGIEVD